MAACICEAAAWPSNTREGVPVVYRFIHLQLVQAEVDLEAQRSELRTEQAALARRTAAVTAQAQEVAGQAAALAAEREGVVQAQALRGELAAKEARLRLDAEAAEAQKQVRGG